MSDNNINTKINFGSETFKRYFANTSWMFAEKIFKTLVAFFVGIYVARYLGPGQFGLLNYAISFAGLFTSFANLGMDSIVVRELVKNPERRDEILGTVFRLRLIGSVVTIILVSITAFIINEPSFNLILIVIISAATIFQSLGVIEQFFQSRVEAKFNVVAQSGSFFIASIIKVLLVVFNQPLIYFAIVQTLESVLLAIGYYTVYKKNSLSFSHWKFNKKTATELFKDSWPLVLSGVVIAIYMKIDQVMIKNFMSATDVGYYAVAVKLCEAWYFVPMAISTSVFPAIVNAKQVSEKLYLSRLQKLYDFLAAISIAIAIPVTLLSDFIINLLFGPEYKPAAPVLTIYIWAGVATFLGVASSQYLISENLTKLSFYRTLLGMIVNVVMNWFLIPIYGINGAAFATLVSYSLATFSVGLTRKTFNQLKMMLKSILLLNILSEIYKYVINIKTKD
ncbi:Membrane protein [Ignavibacterium album JCM 16511]|uniref:Membrane protein n=1 Tax=Ignavibacterium album (strain DSM 19864 / JCM 16511 / NBRC 101810 / Mat9-16) TaxID=945713 RepID=I0ANN4_IGNAJ|nr:flippase [Ignavibacterium album]AFH50591.1 Membrane protein [Ignavibacterium album JCM 16511]